MKKCSKCMNACQAFLEIFKMLQEWVLKEQTKVSQLLAELEKLKKKYAKIENLTRN